MKIKQRLQNLEHKMLKAVTMDFIVRMELAKDDSVKTSILWEVIRYEPSLVGRMDVETVKRFLRAMPPEYYDAVKRKLQDALLVNKADKTTNKH